MYRILRFVKQLTSRQWLASIPLADWEMRKSRYIRPGEYEFDPRTYTLDECGQLDAKHGITYFLKKQVELPAEWSGHPIGLLAEGGGEGLLRVNGRSYQGLDRNHPFVPLYLEGVGSEPLLEIELYDPIPEPVDPLNAQSTINPPVTHIRLRLVQVNAPLQSLLYSVQAAYESMLLLPEQDMNRLKLTEYLYAAMDEMQLWPDERWTDEESLRAVEARLIEQAAALTPNQRSNGLMHMVGQSHIDIAWLWPVRETVRKVSRTFSTMTSLMEEYPDFVYSQSQPLLYEFAKRNDPELYEKIKARVAEGRWELVGGMWVEPDLNIPSGESLVRQMLYGQLFYEQEFGKRSHIEWLPDTFGYCASLPQLLKLADVDYFMTTKLNWNDTNRFPYELFHWVGIDGTSVVSYLNHGLNEHTKPKDVHEHWQSYRHKEQLDELMLLYGHGDGGGGVTREMVELVQRSNLMTGLPESRFSTAAAFFEQVGRKQEELPKWHGDLYLELHRGTYTTHARNKRNNRKAEVLYREAEIWSSLAKPYIDESAAKSALRQGWELMLLNQFHDIIPGTAITETYETSREEYEEVFAIGRGTLEHSIQALAARVQADGDGIPYVVFNGLGWERTDTVAIEGGAELARMAAYDSEGKRLPSDVRRGGGPDAASRTLLVTVPDQPAFGYTTIWLRPSEEPAADVPASLGDSWETIRYVLAFNERGEIVRWFDKAAERELLPEGAAANELQLFHDRPLSWDAWDIDPRFDGQRAASVVLVNKEVVLQGETADILRFEWQLSDSSIQQDMVLHHHTGRVDFNTSVQWHEKHKLLKVAFPLDLAAAKATYEIPFGALERPTHTNTSWEQAQYEVCGHRWADLSEGDYGVSLLNDCKYGYDIKGQTMRLSLLRAPKWPDATADQGEHAFTYSILPHELDWRGAQVVRSAIELNHPATALRVPEGANDERKLPGTQSLIGLQSRSVVLDTVKPAEKGTGTIVRLYESSGSRDRVTLRLPGQPSRSWIVNLLEDELKELDVKDGEVQLVFKPFEVLSIRCE
ncbi:alpha-mannosidase [Paenibacillus phyllosphaerae]|uniref:alpha-mannosidase n=1 Tax=Paenibacillus phyllosphaerae TaxID=274593 RepID=A0A7W5FM67_9BACL|nr:alpha-mannosidase [Paenibacillus phyllosphaerae]MBB3109679.1 alpha-mannosidase [Paenibacillus phyllosphaerae]